ncbi:MAG: NADH dehydrogenase FAD-containing subunit [Verrucomicrobia bacterium]|nr:NADH dehydrogenase FAD-containing subunit [Verrucomicrobiota bacterium]
MSLLLIVIVLPAVSGVAAYFIRAHRVRRLVWGATAGVHFALSIKVSLSGVPVSAGAWIGVDPLSALFLPLTSLLFLAATLYGIGYVAREPVAPRPDFEDGRLFRNEPESVFTGCLLLFLSSMSLAILSRHLGLQWVAIEATTLSSAPLIYYHQNRRSLEAAWNYIILCSVGIAVALLGIFFLAMATQNGSSDLTIQALIRKAGRLDHGWLGTAFIMVLVGYGTKMGLAPLHTWLPDAHSEAPSAVSALLSGALLNCAFLGILRVQQICVASGMAVFGQDLLILFGILSMGIAAVFILRQADFKRLLAYSSIEHMGILSLGVGLGGIGLFGSLLHAVNHSVVKAMLFMTAGNILAAYRTKSTTRITGLCRTAPVSGVLWVVGFLAITGSPPFGAFVSEFTILRAAIGQGHWIVATAYLLLLSVVFVGMGGIVFRMALGSADRPALREAYSASLPPIALAVLALILGLWLPSRLVETLNQAALLLGGGAR